MIKQSEDPEGALQGLILRVEEAKIFGARAVAFRLERAFSRGPKFAARVYLESLDGVRLEAAPSAGIDGSGTGNRIFMYKEFLTALGSADCLVFEVDTLDSNPGVFVRALQSVGSRLRRS